MISHKSVKSLYTRCKTIQPHTWRRVCAAILFISAGLMPFMVMGRGTHGGMLIPTDTPRDWSKLFLYITFVFLLYTLLRPEAIACWKRLSIHPFLQKHWHWFKFFVCTVCLVFVVETCSIAFYGRFPTTPCLLTLFWNTLVLFFLVSILFSLTNRLAFSIGMVYLIYIAAFVINITKVQYLRSTVRPLDIHYLSAFGEVSAFFFSKTLITAAILAAVLSCVLAVVLWWKSRYRTTVVSRLMLTAFSLVGLVALAFCDKSEAITTAFKAVNFHKNLSHGIHSSTRRGFLLEFLTDIPDAIPHTPKGYSETKVASLMKEYYGGPTTNASSNDPVSGDHVNVIFYLIESFMDPMDLNMTFTSDPIPNFHKAAREHTTGRAIVSQKFMGSTNTEFEILTGLSCSILPDGSCPYVQYVKNDMPCLANYFQDHGYTTLAAHAGPPCLYDRVTVYKHFNLGETIWLTEVNKQAAGLPSDMETMSMVNVDVSGRWPTDDSLVDAVIETSKQHPKLFMYASANSTHSPYNYTGYLASDLDVCDPLPQLAKNEVKTYINALRTSDKALGKLLDYFQNSKQKTIIVVIGDHWPPFYNSTDIYAASGCLDEADSSQVPLKGRGVPILIWTNFKSKDQDFVCSMNYLGNEVISRAGMKPTGFWGVNDALRKVLPVLSNNSMAEKDLKVVTSESISPEAKRILEDYQLMQYDILLGQRYSLLGL